MLELPPNFFGPLKKFFSILQKNKKKLPPQFLLETPNFFSLDLIFFVWSSYLVFFSLWQWWYYLHRSRDSVGVKHLSGSASFLVSSPSVWTLLVTTTFPTLGLKRSNLLFGEVWESQKGFKTNEQTLVYDGCHIQCMEANWTILSQMCWNCSLQNIKVSI